MILRLSVPLLVILFLALVAEATHKCVWVTGVLRCNKNPKNHMNVEVRAYDKDGISILQAIDPDDLMGISFTEADGSFKLDGCGDDFNWLPGVPNLPDPYITIKHYCNGEKGETIRLPEFDVFVPDTYDIGVLELDEASTPDKTPITLPTGNSERNDRDPNRSFNSRFLYKQAEVKSKEAEEEHREVAGEDREPAAIITKPDSLIDIE